LNTHGHSQKVLKIGAFCGRSTVHTSGAIVAYFWSMMSMARRMALGLAAAMGMTLARG